MLIPSHSKIWRYILSQCDDSLRTDSLKVGFIIDRFIRLNGNSTTKRALLRKKPSGYEIKWGYN
jgi:hypothetical protein